MPVSDFLVEEFGEKCRDKGWDHDPDGGLVYVSGAKSGLARCEVGDMGLELSVRERGPDARLYRDDQTLGTLDDVEAVRSRGGALRVATNNTEDRSTLTLRDME